MSSVGSWDDLTALSPDAADALSGVVAAAWASTDPALLELARLRIATLLGYSADLGRRTPRAIDAGIDEEKVRELASWPSSPLFTARERACLAFTEQFVIDANGVTDELVAEVTAHLGAAGCYAFAEAVSVLETFARACLVLGIDDPPGP
jgi:alkylhydroperoxidase family enzyme